MNAMEKANSTMARQIAQAASAFEQQRTGNTPKSVTVVLSDTTLVITLHGALSEAEKALAKSPEGAAQVQDFHRQLFVNASESLRQEIKRITGVEVREATAEVEPTSGTVAPWSESSRPATQYRCTSSPIACLRTRTSGAERTRAPDTTDEIKSRERAAWYRAARTPREPRP
jgi:uncharacterized protein YbcI